MMHGPGEISEWLVVIGLAVSVLVSSPVVGGGVEIEGVTFADTFHAGPLPMPLQGVGVAKFLRTIKVYVGALYLAPGTKPERVLDDVPKRLELSYFRAIQAGDFGRAAMKVLADNVSPATITRLKPRIEQLHRLYQDVKPGRSLRADLSSRCRDRTCPQRRTEGHCRGGRLCRRLLRHLARP
jgi:hypothetical protein